MIGLHGKTHFELESFINMTEFDNIQIDIWQGIAEAKSIAENGYLVPFPVFNPLEISQPLPVRPLMTAYQTYLSLPNDDLIKVKGTEILDNHGQNALATFIKYAYGAHDLGTHYLFWDYIEGWRSNTNHRSLTKVSHRFPSLVTWIDNLMVQGIFSNIGRAYLIALDSNAYSFEHRDPHHDPDVSEDVISEFIHIRPNLKRQYYIYDNEKKEKHYIKSRIGWWNDKTLHGGEVCLEPSYAIRIDGIFSNTFREKIGVC